MTKKGLHILENLEEQYLQHIDLVVIGRDKDVKNDYSSEIEELCRIKNLTYIFDTGRSPAINSTSNLNIVVSWRWILPFHPNRMIVLHDSILPKYRGFAPLVNMLINGEKEIGVTALFANGEYDKGNVISQTAISVNYPIKIAEAINLIANCYSKLINDILEKIHQNMELAAVPQNEENASYSLWRGEEDYRINWQLDAKVIKRFVDAVGYPYSGASSLLNGVLHRVLDCEIVKDVYIESRDQHLGKQIFLIENYPVIVCGSGLLKITSLQVNGSPDSILPLKKFRNIFS